MESQLEHVDGSSDPTSVFQQVHHLLHTFERVQLVRQHGKKKKKPSSPPKRSELVMWWRVWSWRYDAYALDIGDEQERCAFLMVHLLFEWMWGLVRRSFSDQTVTAEFDWHRYVTEAKALQLWKTLRDEEPKAWLAQCLTIWGWILHYSVRVGGYWGRVVTAEEGHCHPSYPLQYLMLLVSLLVSHNDSLP